jgi:geranylgeranyl reductase family protein
MKRVAVLGGGPAGAFAAERLASAGLDAVVFDEKLAWEKPCGGGLTYKAYQRYPFLRDNSYPKRFVTQTMLAAPGAGAARLSLSEPLLIYSRLDLNTMLLERAARAGARLEKTRVLALARHGSRWRVRTAAGTLDADFCVIATGARNALRGFGTEWTGENTMRAMGYYIEAQQEHIDIQFLPGTEGYIWIFPRAEHLSVGICGKGVPSSRLRARLEAFMQERAIDWKGARFFSHVLPSLAAGGWRENRVAGPGWLAVGDAGGLVDPITGEGLYYAMRSGDLAAQVLLDDAHAPAGKHRVYRSLLADDFAADLAFGSAIARRLFLGKFLFGSVPQRMVQFLRRSPRFHDIVQDLFAGKQTYRDLKRRLKQNLEGTMLDTFFHFVLSREAAGENQP